MKISHLLTIGAAALLANAAAELAVHQPIPGIAIGENPVNGLPAAGSGGNNPLNGLPVQPHTAINPINGLPVTIAPQQRPIGPKKTLKGKPRYKSSHYSNKGEHPTTPARVPEHTSRVGSPGIVITPLTETTHDGKTLLAPGAPTVFS